MCIKVNRLVFCINKDCINKLKDNGTILHYYNIGKIELNLRIKK